MQPHWLKDRRKELDMQQGELAARLEVAGFNVTQSSISHWENGRYTLPLDDPNFRQSLAKALKLSVPELLERAGYEVIPTIHSEKARRAAAIIERLPEDAQDVALDLLKSLEKRYVG